MEREREKEREINVRPETSGRYVFYILHLTLRSKPLITHDYENSFSWSQCRRNQRPIDTCNYSFYDTMGHKATFEGALYFTKLSVYLACTWPPSAKATKWETTKYNIVWCISFLSALCLFFPLMFAIFKPDSNLFIITQSACFVGAVTNLMLKMIVYRLHIKQTQNLIHEMEEFLQNAEPHEKMIVQRYVDRCSYFHVVISVINYLTTAMVVTAPLLNPNQPFPTSATYPFSVESGAPMYLAYLHQSIAGFQCSSGVTIDCQAAVMMWFACARLEILAQEAETVADINGFESFVRKHRKLLSYASQVSDTMSYVAFASSTACGIAAIMSGLQLFGNQPLAVKIQFAPVAVIASINLFICAWPADNLINACEVLGSAIYNSSWVDTSTRMKRNLIIVLLRCQRPIIVSVAGFLPILSLRYYASFLSAACSYFTTLRLVMAADNEK